MIDSKATLNIKHDADGTISDYSHKSVNFGRDVFTITLTTGTDFLFAGFRKPITSVYVNILTSYVTEGTLVGEYWNGSAWNSLSTLTDDTFGMMRSGFISFDAEQIDQVEHEVDSDTKYWYRFSSSETRTDMEISGINLVFADDYELSLEQPVINDESFRGSEPSYIKIHAACRNEIIQRFRNKDYIKTNLEGRKEDINVWDLHNILEVKQAAVFLALAKIYYNVSDSESDVWSIKSASYMDKFEKMIQLARLSLDTNDNGIPEIAEEKVRFVSRRLMR